MTSSGRVAAFFRLNTRLSDYAARRFGLESAESPSDFGDERLDYRFDESVATALNGLPDNALVVDVGGGHWCRYAHIVPRDRGVRLVAVDSSADQLAPNDYADETRVADIVGSLPFRDEEVGLVTSQYVFEHVSDVPAAVRNIHRVLGRGGTTIHLCPCRFALFAIAARTMPFGPLKSVLHLAYPQTVGSIEFDVYYDKCFPSAIRQVFLDAGFQDVHVDVFWSQHGFFKAVFPLYLLVCCYEWLVRTLGVRDLAAYMLVQARK
jgi:SAM-dependent methyltransferase